MSIFVVLTWIGLSLIVGVAANNRFRRNGADWFFVALFISPLIAMFALFAVGPAEPGTKGTPIFMPAAPTPRPWVVHLVGIVRGHPRQEVLPPSPVDWSGMDGFKF
jgi:hypothetical protein